MGKLEAQEALFTAIEAQAKDVAVATLGTAGKSKALADLAVAYRYVAGGPQPGNVSVEK